MARFHLHLKRSDDPPKVKSVEPASNKCGSSDCSLDDDIAELTKMMASLSAMDNFPLDPDTDGVADSVAAKQSAQRRPIRVSHHLMLKGYGKTNEEITPSDDRTGIEELLHSNGRKTKDVSTVGNTGSDNCASVHSLVNGCSPVVSTTSAYVCVSVADRTFATNRTQLVECAQMNGCVRKKTRKLEKTFVQMGEHESNDATAVCFPEAHNTQRTECFAREERAFEAGLCVPEVAHCVPEMAECVPMAEGRAETEVSYAQLESVYPLSQQICDYDEGSFEALEYAQEKGYTEEYGHTAKRHANGLACSQTGGEVLPVEIADDSQKQENSRSDQCGQEAPLDYTEHNVRFESETSTLPVDSNVESKVRVEWEESEQYTRSVLAAGGWYDAVITHLFPAEPGRGVRGTVQLSWQNDIVKNKLFREIEHIGQLLAITGETMWCRNRVAFVDLRESRGADFGYQWVRVRYDGPKVSTSTVILVSLVDHGIFMKLPIWQTVACPQKLVSLPAATVKVTFSAETSLTVGQSVLLTPTGECSPDGSIPVEIRGREKFRELSSPRSGLE